MSDDKKNPAAVALGRLGGKARVPKGFSKFDPERRLEISRRGVEARQRKKEQELQRKGEHVL